MNGGHHQRRSNGETIQTTSPDLKQFLEQIKGKRIETKPSRALLQSPCFLPFQKVVAFFGPGGAVAFSSYGSLGSGQDCFKVVFGS